jgi:hypothetical protein
MLALALDVKVAPKSAWLDSHSINCRRSFVHDAHPTATKLFDNPVVGEDPADQPVGVRHSVARRARTSVTERVSGGGEPYPESSD